MKRVLSLLLAAVLLCSLFPSAMAEAIYTPGTYTSTAKGMDSIVMVTMTFSETEITNVKIDVSGETPGIGGSIGPTMEERILKAQYSSIDGVSGATVTSTAIKDAAADCISMAMGQNHNASLVAAQSLIHLAEADIISTSSLQIEEWTKYSSIMMLYFDDLYFTEHYDSKDSSGIDKAAKKMHDYRVSAKGYLDSAKTMIKNFEEKDDLYEAVKDYYKVVNKFYSLVSTFPEGYSKLTFMQAVADYKAECQDAYAEVEFNM